MKALSLTVLILASLVGSAAADKLGSVDFPVPDGWTAAKRGTGYMLQAHAPARSPPATPAPASTGATATASATTAGTARGRADSVLRRAAERDGRLYGEGHVRRQGVLDRFARLGHGAGARGRPQAEVH